MFTANSWVTPQLQANYFKNARPGYIREVSVGFSNYSEKSLKSELFSEKGTRSHEEKVKASER